MNKCPYCYSLLHKCETKKEKMKESHTLLTKMKDGYKEIIFAKEIEVARKGILAANLTRHEVDDSHISFPKKWRKS